MNNISDTIDSIKSTALAKNVYIAVAESCTGGLISKYLTDLPGSSKFFSFSIISYSNESKMRYLNVKSETLKSHGAVSKEVVSEMCSGLIVRNSYNTIGIAISGIMGPESDPTDKAIGTVWIAIGNNHKIKCSTTRLIGNRQENREAAAKYAIMNLYDFINSL